MPAMEKEARTDGYVEVEGVVRRSPKGGAREGVRGLLFIVRI